MKPRGNFVALGRAVPSQHWSRLRWLWAGMNADARRTYSRYASHSTTTAPAFLLAGDVRVDPHLHPDIASVSDVVHGEPGRRIRSLYPVELSDSPYYVVAAAGSGASRESAGGCSALRSCSPKVSFSSNS